ncbi:MAG TPA: hypothetical protein PKK13_09900 [Spirochaetota bacterium]|jgi:hypothetical protein|nr:hypothetical protein [Spirochaetota bacterium]
MKILYVEDELSKNIPRIIKFFNKHLGETIVKKLKCIQEDDYGAESITIKGLIEQSGIVDVACSFPDALYKIMNNHSDYSLFIVDRNLIDSSYTLAELNKIDSTFDEPKINENKTREGDYLFEKLAFQEDMMGKMSEVFYFLSAYNPDGLAKKYIDNNKFKSENYISKSDDSRLINKIDGLEDINLIVENKAVVDIIKKRFSNKYVKRYLSILKNKDSLDTIEISKTLGEIRKFLEKILRTIFESDNLPKSYRDKNGREQLFITDDKISARPMIYYLDNDCKVSSVIYCSLESIYSISSDFGSHDSDYTTPDKSGFYPTVNTVKSVIFGLNDIILWMDGFI